MNEQIKSIHLTHKTTSKNILSKLDYSYRKDPHKIHKIFDKLKNSKIIQEYFLIITCHRFEIYFILNKNIKNSKKMISQINQLTKVNKTQLNINNSLESLSHLIRVASGVESKIMGEKDIFVQIKNYLNLAILSKNVENILKNFINYSLKKATKYRKESKIDKEINSYSQIPLEIIKKMKYNKKSNILILGTGMLGLKIVKELIKKDFKNIYIASRNYKKNKKISKKFKINAIRFKDIQKIIGNINILITCFIGEIFSFDYFNQSISREILCIDLGVPFNLNPKIQKIKNIKLYGINNFSNILNKNKKNKKNQLLKITNFLKKDFKNFKKYSKR